MPDLSLKRPSAFLPAAGWIPLPGRSQIRLTGADRAKFLHNFCTNDIKKLKPGQGCEAFLTNIKGRILGHIFVFAGENDLLVDTIPGEDAKIRDHLDRFLITEDVQIEVVTGQFQFVYIFGEQAVLRIREAFDLDVSPLAEYGQLEKPRSPAPMSPAWIRRMDLTVQPGFEIAMSTSAEPPPGMVFVHLNPQAPQPVLVDEQSFAAFRIDVGFPHYGVDLTDEHLAQEAARTAKAISFTKGCYLGQEPIARIDALGHVNRELRVVAFDNADALAAPSKVLDASTKAELGTLTSVGRVPGRATVGLGMLRTSAKPGTSIIASTEKGEFAGQVVEPTTSTTD
jgi:tRNA-modifying protein YgfZ